MCVLLLPLINKTRRVIDATAEKDLNLTDFLRCDMWEIKKYSDSLNQESLYEFLTRLKKMCS